MRVAAVALAGCLLHASMAHAQDAAETRQRTLVVVPFTAVGVDDEEAASLTGAVVKGAEDAGFVAERAKVAMDDLLAINGCSESDEACLNGLPATLGVDVVVFGSARVEAGTATLVVVVIEPGSERVRKRIPLEGATREERATKATSSFSEVMGAAPPVVEPEPTTGDEVIGPPPPPPVTGSFDLSRVERRWWIVGAAGVGAIVTGGLALAIGNNRQSAIDDAATDTRDDLEDLESLETQAKVAYGMGNFLFVGGLVATAISGALVFHQSRPRREEAAAGPSGPSVMVGPTVLPGGAGIAVRVWGWD